MADAQSEIRSWIDTWTKAELAGDTAALDGLLVDDFAGIGPFGFTLDKEHWLDRYNDHALTFKTFSLEEAEIAVHAGGQTAVVRGRQVAEGDYKGKIVPLEHRVTLVLDRRDEGWKLLVVHISFILGSPGAPGMPDAEYLEGAAPEPADA